MQSGNHNSKFCYTTYFLLCTLLPSDEKKKRDAHLHLSPECFPGMEATNTDLSDTDHSILVSQPLKYRECGPSPVQDFSIV